jgi:hypothetical protein
VIERQNRLIFLSPCLTVAPDEKFSCQHERVQGTIGGRDSCHKFRSFLYDKRHVSFRISKPPCAAFIEYDRAAAIEHHRI